MTNKNTKLVCTIGPATNNVDTLVKMAKAGMNVARLNCSHASHEVLAEVIKNVRAAEKKSGLTIALLLDLQGPKIRLGMVPEEGVKLENGDAVVLSTGAKEFKLDKKVPVVPVQYKDLHKDVAAGDTILIEDGLVELTVNKVAKTEIFCQSVGLNILKSKKGINVPTASISANPLSEKDIEDLNYGLKLGVDFVALSFVRNPKDIQDLRNRISKAKSQAKIIAKIERHEAVKLIEEIMLETDGVMVARGDLGVELPAKEVPLIQKKIIAIANELGKPVIVATEVMQSMITQSRPTRAEVSDAANGILDGTDALMTSNETAVGKYPVKTIETMASIAETVEMALQKMDTEDHHHAANTAEALAYAATDLAHQVEAKCLVVFDQHSYLTQQISKARRFENLVIISDNATTARQLALVWGVKQVFNNKIEATKLKDTAVKILTANKLAKKNDVVVLVACLENQQIVQIINV